MDENFLLQTETAQKLYHEHAAKMPIIDYHCHLIPKMVADDHRFKSITEIWLGGDHYKWRAMRSNGVDERFCTGTDTSDWEKFQKWAETVPYTFRNPSTTGLTSNSRQLSASTSFSTPRPPVKSLMNVTTSSSTILDDRTRTHAPLQRGDCLAPPTIPSTRSNTTSRCAKADLKSRCSQHGVPTRLWPLKYPPNSAHTSRSLAEVSGVEINKFNDMIDALQKRHDFFEEMGCRLSDHGIEEFYAEDYTDAEIEAIFDKVYGGKELTKEEILKFKSAMLVIFGEMDYESGWTQQFHYGAIRNNNTKMFKLLGPDTGFDSIGEFTTAKACAKFLDTLNTRGKLTKTILYNLNPCANEVIATMLGNFQDGTVAGKIHLGSGWWFLDQKDGMEKQMNALSLLGLLSRFVGMLTDSRSFLSYPRHEYFRRTLCNLVGNDVENGLIPYTGYEENRVNQMIEDICYNNAKNYFKF